MTASETGEDGPPGRSGNRRKLHREKCPAAVTWLVRYRGALRFGQRPNQRQTDAEPGGCIGVARSHERDEQPSANLVIDPGTVIADR